MLQTALCKIGRQKNPTTKQKEKGIKELKKNKNIKSPKQISHPLPPKKKLNPKQTILPYFRAIFAVTEEFHCVSL